MKYSKWFFYELSTGLFTGRAIEGSESAAVRATPQGQGRYEARAIDHLSQRVDSAGEVIGWQPPQPDTDHEWNASTKRWQLNAAAAAAAAAHDQAESDIAALEREQLRPLRELRMDPGATFAKRKLADIDTKIAIARIKLLKDVPRFKPHVSLVDRPAVAPIARVIAVPQVITHPLPPPPSKRKIS